MKVQSVLGDLMVAVQEGQGSRKPAGTQKHSALQMAWHPAGTPFVSHMQVLKFTLHVVC